MNPLKQLAGQTAVYGIGTIVPRLMNYLLLTPFYTRVFGLGEYGMVTELYAYVAFLLVLLTYGMETAYFRFAESQTDKDKVYTTTLLSLFFTSFLFIVLVISNAGSVAGLIQYSANVEYIVYFALIVGIDAFTSIPFARLRQQQRPGRFAMIKIVNVSVNVGLNFFFLGLCPLLIENNPESVFNAVYDKNVGIGYAFIANLAATGVTLLLLLPDIFSVKLRFDNSLLFKMLNYSYPLLIVGLAGMANEHVDKILLKYLLPDSETALDNVGIYGASFKLAVLMTLFTQVFRYAAEPFFFAQAKQSNAKQIYADVMKYFVIFGLLIFLGVMLYIDVVKYFIGSDFHEGLHIVPIILMANLFLGIFYNLSVWYKLNNLTKFGAYIAISGALVTIVLNVLLIPVLGYLGSAWAHFACYFVMMVMSYFLGRKYYPIRYDLKKIGTYVFVAIALFAISQYLKPENVFLGYLLNSVLFISFLSLAYFQEKRGFSGTQ